VFGARARRTAAGAAALPKSNCIVPDKSLSENAVFRFVLVLILENRKKSRTRTRRIGLGTLIPKI
jgi:hypothetical protein